MKVITSLEAPCETPLILTIGNFDGVHLGHRAILNALQKYAKAVELPSCVITFSNHPSTILRPNHPALLLTSKEHKLKLLEEIGIDCVYMLEFTLPFSRQSAVEFLRKIYKHSPFRRLILGQDAKLGNDRQGNTPFIHQLAHELHFNLDFLPLETAHQEPISSSRIRQAVQELELPLAAELLGRKYSILGKVLRGTGRGRKLGYPTLNLSLNGLCHPPFGVYAVTTFHNEQKYLAVANVGIAPTLRHDHIPLLEVHIIDLKGQDLNLYDQTVEVSFEEFFRPERVFASREELKTQIQADIEEAKNYFA